MQVYAAFAQIHNLVLILSLAMCHILEKKEEGLFGRVGEEEENGKAEELLRFFY